MLTSCPQSFFDPRHTPGVRTMQPALHPARPAPAARWAWVTLWLIAGSTLSLTNTGCGASPKGGTKPVRSVDKAEVDTGLTTLLSNKPMAVLPAPDPRDGLTAEQKAAWANQSALQLEELLKSGEVDELGRPRPRPSETAAAPVDSPPPNDQSLAALTPPPEPAPTSAASSTADAASSQPTTPTPTPPTPANPLLDTAAKMASLLRATDAAGKPLIDDASALTPIEAMQAGVVATLSDAGSPLASLAGEDKATLLAARERLLANPGTTNESLLTSLRGPQAASVATLAISRAALCVRVDGFGRFEPYPSTTFVAGKAIRAIVYTELDGFQTRPARESDRLQFSVPMQEQVSVDLAQEISLYHDADGLLAWHRPAQGVVETSRSKRRDFYLIQIIDLPSTLSIGRYNLKVTVTDRTNSTQAQTILPIEVVADPSLVAGGGY